MQDVDVRRKVWCEIEAGTAGPPGIQLDQRSIGYARPSCGQQRDTVAQLCQPPDKPFNDSLGSTVPRHRNRPVEIESDVHGGPMYRTHKTPAKQAA